MVIINRYFWLASAALVIVVSGCGGGGGGSAAASGSSQVRMFVTDSPRDDFSHVWLTIFSVQLLDASGNSVNVFTDSKGVTLDLKTLRDASGQRFAFLSAETLPTGTYTKAQIVVVPAVALVPNGATDATLLHLDDSVPIATTGLGVIEVNLATPLTTPASRDIVLDFDLANFRVQNGKLHPAVKEGAANSIADAGRHERELYGGTISELSGTTGTFAFKMTGDGHSVQVSTDENTVLFNGDSSPSPLLINGQKVHVFGRFDVATNTIRATSVQIEAGPNADKGVVRGPASNINTVARTFDITLAKTHGLRPVSAIVHIAVRDFTAFRGPTGVLLRTGAFFARLAAAAAVEVEGSYDSTTNTLFVFRANLVDDIQAAHGGREAEVNGQPGAVNSFAGSFTVDPVTEFEGFAFGGIGGIDVGTTASTTYQNGGGSVLSRDDFFNVLPAAGSVRVEGALTGRRILATNVRIIR